MHGDDSASWLARVTCALRMTAIPLGLALPPIIMLLYARDSSTPLARLELGTAAENFGRYARLAPNGDVVTIAEFEVQRLTDLLKAVGAGT